MNLTIQGKSLKQKFNILGNTHKYTKQCEKNKTAEGYMPAYYLALSNRQATRLLPFLADK